MSQPDEMHDDETTTRVGGADSRAVAPTVKPPAERPVQGQRGARGKLDVAFILLASAAGWAAIVAIVGLGVLIARPLF